MGLTSMIFEKAFERLIGHEGGFSKNPKDPGNWAGGKPGLGKLLGTKYGVAANTWPHEDIANLTLARAREIYRFHYWGPAGCEAVPEALRFDLFDMAVNSGVRAAVKTLQGAAGEVQDGSLGPRTLQAINSMPALRLIMRFNGKRLDFMTNLPNWPENSRGWARRIASNLMI